MEWEGENEKKENDLTNEVHENKEIEMVMKDSAQQTTLQ